MASQFLLGYLVFCVLLNGQAVSQGFDWYRNQMITRVVPLYSTAYRILHDEIIQPILQFDQSLIELGPIDTEHDWKSEGSTNPTTTISTDAGSEDCTTTASPDDDYDEAGSEDETTTPVPENDDEPEVEDYTTTSSPDDDDEEAGSEDETTPSIPEYGNDDSARREDTINVGIQDESTSEEEDASKKKRSIDEVMSSDEESVVDVDERNNGNLKTLEIANTIEESDSKELNTTELFVLPSDQVADENNRLKSLVDEIGKAAHSVHNYLGNASNECDHLRKDLAKRITEATLDISKQEAELEQLQKNIADLVSSIAYRERDVIFAQQVFDERKTALQNAEREHQAARRRVEEARLCRGRRRRKRFSDWWYRNIERPVVQAVEFAIIKPICSVVNMNGIDIAKDARDLAENTLNSAQHQLTTQQQLLSEKRQQLTSVEVHRHLANGRQQALQTQLSTMQDNFKGISNVLSQFLFVRVHLSSVLVSSEELKTALKRLLDFHLVVEPLQRLAEQMIKDQLMPSFHFDIAASTIARVDRILDRLSDKLDRLPLLLPDSVFEDDVK